MAKDEAAGHSKSLVEEVRTKWDAFFLPHPSSLTDEGVFVFIFLLIPKKKKEFISFALDTLFSGQGLFPASLILPDCSAELPFLPVLQDYFGFTRHLKCLLIPLLQILLFARFPIPHLGYYTTSHHLPLCDRGYCLYT